MENEKAVVRRVPSQQRSRERVQRILAVATSLIATNGSDLLRMSDVAEQAGISIGSLYQYFPDKAAIIWTLTEQYNAQGRACVEAELATVHSDTDLETALFRITDGYYAMFLGEPVMRDLWSATQADKMLQEMDAADAATHTALLSGVLERLRPDYDHAELAVIALLTMQLIATTVRLAISVERSQGDALIALFKQKMLKNLLDKT